MQQYFVQEPLQIGQEYVFTKEQAHHAKTVVRLQNETVRLVYEGKGYFAKAYQKENRFVALVEREDPRINEVSSKMTLAMALIRREKMELILQKATEIGVSRIIPFTSSRCIVKEKKEKKEKLQERWNTIVLEASQQCKRNCIPEVSEIVPFSSLKTLQADYRLCAYENAYGKSRSIHEVIEKSGSSLVVIGPEGGFSMEEVKELEEAGYTSITLGKRILRAETAALFSCSVLAELLEDNE